MAKVCDDIDGELTSQPKQANACHRLIQKV
jgi:hypothetical protein